MKVFRSLALLCFVVTSSVGVRAMPGPAPSGESYRVLVVMSYEADNPWCEEIKEGVESVFSRSAELDFFYMDTKIDIEGGAKKAEEAYGLFKGFAPDGVIAADDNAQSLLVVPYLTRHPDTPVMFCGVNAEPAQYGYPAPNVSGIIERGHIRESIALAKQLIPSLDSVAFLAKDSPSGRELFKKIKNESHSYLVKTATYLLTALSDLNSIGESSLGEVDAFYIDSIEGLRDLNGEPMNYEDVVEYLNAEFSKPVIGANRYHVELGALCAVVKTGQEQGETAARMLVQAMQGRPVQEIPIVQNFKGRRVINVAVMKALGLSVRPITLLGAELIR